MKARENKGREFTCSRCMEDVVIMGSVGCGEDVEDVVSVVSVVSVEDVAESGGHC